LRKPLLADGTLVKDYTPLFMYVERLSNLGVSSDEVTLKSEDLRYLEELISRGSLPLNEVIERLIEYFMPRLRSDIAKEVVSEYLGSEVSTDFGTRFMAKILACWLIEAGKTLGIVSLRGASMLKG